MKKVLLSLLSLLVGLLCLVVFTAQSAVGTLLSDAHSDALIGPGVDLFRRDPAPTPGGVLSLEVHAHGGKKALLKSVVVSLDDGPPRVLQGHGEDALIVALPIDERLPVGSAHTAFIEATYTTEGGRSREAQERHLQLPFVLSSPAGQLWERLLMLSGALLLLGGFLWLGVRVARLVRAHEAASPGDAESVGYLLLCVLLLSGLGGYWFFVWPLQKALGLHGMFFAVGLMMLWFVLPLWVIWRDATRPTARSYALHLQTRPAPASDGDPYRSQGPAKAVFLSLEEVAALLRREGYRPRRWLGVLWIRKGDTRLRISQDGPNTLRVVTRLRSVVALLAQQLANHVGTVYLHDGKISETFQSPTATHEGELSASLGVPPDRSVRRGFYP